MKKKKLAIVSLMSDGGCHVAFLDMHENILQLLQNVELVHSYMVLDVRRIPDSVDIVLVEGGVRTSHDVEVLKEARRKAKILVALGSCACFGGIPGLSNLFDLYSSLKYVYEKTPTVIKGVIPRENVPEVVGVSPISRYVKVDFQIPGCPPEPKEIMKVILSLAKGEKPTLPTKTICDECPLGPPRKKPSRLRRIFESPKPNTCLLEQGYFCMGPVTRAGCGAKCPRAGIPCDGCRGAAIKILDQGAAMLNTLATIAYNTIKNFNLRTYSAYFYRYSFASSLIENLIRKTKVKKK